MALEDEELEMQLQVSSEHLGQLMSSVRREYCLVTRFHISSKIPPVDIFGILNEALGHEALDHQVV